VNAAPLEPDGKSPERWVVAVAALGIALRLWLTLTTVGTDDIRNSALWADAALQFGLVHAYDHSVWLNHPPLGLAEMASLRFLAASAGVPFILVFRLAQTLADVVAYACLLRIGRRSGVGAWVAPFYFLSVPAVLMGGFHGNSDSTMVALVLVAAALSTRRPAAAGVALAAATGIKIVPLLLAPAFFLAARGRSRFAAGWSVVMVLLFGVPTIFGGAALLRNTLLYRGMGDWWGFVSMLIAAARRRSWLDPMLEVIRKVDPGIVVALVLAIACWLWRELRAGADEPRALRLLLAACGMVFVTLLVAGTGFGVQYLLWPMPFLPFFARPSLRVAVSIAASLFLVVVYTRWSGGFPWRFAISTRPGATTDALVAGGWLVWATLLAAGIAGPRWASRARYPPVPAEPAGAAAVSTS